MGAFDDLIPANKQKWWESDPIEGAAAGEFWKNDPIESLGKFVPDPDQSFGRFVPDVARKRTWGEAAADTAVQLAEGVNTISGAVPNLVAPEGRTAEFFRDNADYWRDKQSDVIKGKIARADEAITAAGEDGVIAQIAEAAGQYFNDPVLAARFVTTNLPSMIPGLAVTKLTHAATLARGASAARAASLATTAGGAANAVLNAGGARGDAFEDIKRTLEAKGYSTEQAEQIALSDSRVAAAVGAVTGYVSGKTGLEGSIVGKVGAGGAMKAGGRAAMAELAGEQIEEVSPKLTTNYLASEYDNRSIGQDVGRTIVETAIGSGPGAVVAGGATAMNARAQSNAEPEANPSQNRAPAVPGNREPTSEGSSHIERAMAARSGNEAPGGTVPPQMRPEVRLAELDLLGQSRPLTEQEVDEAKNLLRRMDEGDTTPNALDQADVPVYQPVDEPVSAPTESPAPVEAEARQAPSAPVQVSDKALTNFWTYAKERGYNPGQIRVGTELHSTLKAEYLQAKTRTTPASVLPSLATQRPPASQPVAAAPVPGIDPALQNRDRSRAASLVQMADIARNPDYMRLATSRSPDAGAPMVFAVEDDIARIPQGNEGRADVAVMTDGQRVPFRYAVVDARTVEPSNLADGRVNQAYADTVPGTLKALNNGRTAGLRAAYDQGTAGNYQAELIADAEAHGVAVEAIQRTPNPILVRVYSERSNTPDMAAKSQGQGLGMSPAELARQDAPLIDANVLTAYQPGDVTSAANRDFVRAFVGKLNQAGQDVAGMMTADGTLSPAGRQRIQAALMQSAYGDSDLVEGLFDSLETDIKAIGETLKIVAGEWSNMRDSASQGLINSEADITDNLVQAVQLIRKARRDRTSLYELTRQPDLMIGEVPDPLTIGALRLFYRGEYLTTANGREAMVAALRDYVRTAMGTSASADMFGEIVTPADILDNLNDPGARNAQDQAQKGTTDPDGRSDPVGSADTTLQADSGLSSAQASPDAGANRAGERSDVSEPDGGSREAGKTGNETDRLTDRPARSAEARIEDVGQQLYANRRNFTGRGLKWEDVAEFNDTLKLKEVTKAKVWPRPDYEKLIADGMPPVLARVVKQVYDGLGAGPTVRTGTPTDADLQRYIETLAKVREALFGFINDRQQVADFAKGVLAQVNAEPTALGPISVLDLARTAMDGQQVATVLLRRVWPQEFDKPTMGRFTRGTPGHAEISVLGGNKALGALQFTRSDISKWVADLSKGWPAKREAWEVQGYRVLAPDQYRLDQYDGKQGTVHTLKPVTGRGSWASVVPFSGGKFALVLDGGSFAREFDTRAAAVEAAREKVKRAAGAGQDIRGTNIEAAERTGPARRQEGEDISAQRLMDTFGFRGVNFGREGWIKQAERQAYLNQAHDGLLDLAEILGVPPKAMSLNGELGIAFGAQGKGRFAAHFVPGVNEINLTRTRGAGTLAHEWGHALDHYFGKQADLAKAEEPFLSQHSQGARLGGEIRPEIVQAFRAIQQAMTKRAETIGEANTRRDAAMARARRNVDGWLASARRQIEGSTADNKKDLLTDFDQHVEKLREGDTGDGYDQAGKQTYSARVAAIRNLIKDATGRLWSTDETQALDANASHLKSLQAKKDADAGHEPQLVDSQYKQDSTAMDREKGGRAYWGTPTEMFARAFELYVHDKLSQRGASNTFLTDASERAANPVQVKESSSAMTRGASSTRDLYLYPVGKERESLREAFDKLVGKLKTRETEQGVAMFSRAARAPNVGDEQTGVSVALLELGKLEKLYQHPKSSKIDLPGIAADKGMKAIPVTKAKMLESKVVAAQTLAMSMSDKPGAKFWMAKTDDGKLGMITEVDGEIYIDVSVGGTGRGGSAIYDTALNYAANSKGKVFIGDPNDLSKAGMSRRLENMLSGAIKYQGTDFMAPHQYQLEGRYGFAPLKWTRGDTLGNIRSMVDASIAATSKTNPKAAENVEFNADTQSFTDGWGVPLDDAGLSGMLAFDARVPGSGQAGGTTLRRGALYKSLVQSVGNRAALVEFVHREQNSGRQGAGSALEKQFYSRARQSRQPALSQKSVQEIADAIKARWKNAPEIIVVKDMADQAIPEKAREHNNSAQQSQGALGDPEGFFYGGKVYMVADTMKSPADVLRVLFHESLGHAGLSGVFGDSLKPILQQIVMVRRAEVAAKAKEYGLDMSKESDRLQAAEEVLANMAQDRPELGFVKRAIAAIRTWLRENVPGFKDLDLTDAEIIRDFILPARQFVESGHMPEAKKPATAKTQVAFSRNTLGDKEPEQIGPEQQTPWTRAKAKVMELSSPQALERLIYEFQDKYIDLKNVREHIHAIGGTITDLNDAYLGEELYHKRLAKRTEDFLVKEIKPLLAGMRSRAVKLEEFERYLHARHAPEANRALAERNPNRALLDEGRAKAQDDVRQLELKLQSAVAKGMSTKAVEDALIEARAQASKWVGAQVFRGDEAQRLALSGMSDQEAKAFIDGLTPVKRKHMEALADQVTQVQDKTLDMLEKYGLMDKATLASWRSEYRFYVPLHRDEAHADSDRHPIGQGFSVKGTGVKSRVGSTEKVTNILAHIAMQREAALTRGEKNNVVKKLYLMAAQNPDDDFWGIDNPPKIKTIDPNTGFVRMGVDPRFKNLPHVVMVRIAGKDQAIVFNEHNPRAVRLAEAMKNLDVGDLHVVLGLAAKGTRWFASVNTQYNPIFGLINFARDVQAGLLNLSTTEIKDQSKAVASNIPAAMRAIYRERRGKQASSTEWSRLWDDFQDVGGTTGYRDLYADAQDRANALAKELAALDRGEVSKSAHAVVDWLSHYNETMENSVRLAAYKVALDHGMSKERAASLAKNLTVNFNRKGRQAREIGALYAFFNAAIQGTTRMAETLKGPLGKRIIYGGVLLGVVNTLIGMAAMGGGDDGEPDNWEKVPEFIKERSLIIPLGREDYLSIPMPLGFHVLPNIGRLAVEFALGGSDKTAGRQMGRLMQVLADAFNPLGGAQNLGQVVAPTVIDPVVALMQNRDWTGKPIYREANSPLDPQPGHKMVKDSASTPSRLVAEALNRITGGTEYRPGAWSPTPDQLDYVIGQLTGGLGRELLKANQTIASTVTGDELPPYKIPLVGRLYGNTRGPAGQSEKFYENVKMLNEFENEYRGRARNNQDPHGFMQSEPLARLIPMANQSEAAMRKLREYRRTLTERQPEGYQDKVREIDAKIGEIMGKLNDAVSKARKEERHAKK